jgi:hypothetical protein
VWRLPCRCSWNAGINMVPLQVWAQCCARVKMLAAAPRAKAGASGATHSA